MRTLASRVVAIVLLVVLGGAGLYLAGNPSPVSVARSVEPRGALTDGELLTISVFKRVSRWQRSPRC